MNRFIYNLVGLLLIANFASAQGNTYLRGDFTKSVSEQPRSLDDEPIINNTGFPTIEPTTIPEPVVDCYAPYYSDGTSCQLCDNGIISLINPDSDIQECTPCGANEYIKDNACVSSCSCAAEGDWATTYCGYYAFRACPTDTMGTSRRFCNNGVWSEIDDSGCLSTSDIDYGSGAGMITIPITLKDYPPFADSKEIPLYLIKAILNQYPYQLNDIQVIMENIYDNENKNQIARILVRSNSIFGKAISSSMSTSVNEIADRLENLNNVLFNNKVTSNIEVDSETIEEFIQPGICFYEGRRVEEVPVSYSTDTKMVNNCNTPEEYLFQCTQNLLDVFPYYLSYHSCDIPSTIDFFFIAAKATDPIDFIKSNFYKDIHGLLLSTIKYPKNQLFIESATSKKITDSEDITMTSGIFIGIRVNAIYQSAHMDFLEEITEAMKTDDFKTRLETMSNVKFGEFIVGHQEY